MTFDLENLPTVGSQISVDGELVTIVAAMATTVGTDLVIRRGNGSLADTSLSREDLARAMIPVNDAGGDPERALTGIWGRWMQHAVPRIRSAVLATRPLRPFAHRDEAVFTHMLAQPRLRFLLADEPGTGKTIMTGMYLAEGTRRGFIPGLAIIVVPAHLVEKWRRDLRRYFAIDAGRLAPELARDPKDLDPRVKVWVVSVDLYTFNPDVRRKVSGMRSSWSLAVFDEAHRLTPTSRFLGAADGSARQLYRSLERFGTLQEYLQVWPGHGASSACGRALGAVPQSTVGYERRTNWAMEPMPEERFVADVLAEQPDPPPYFARMKRVNKEGPAAVGDTPAPAPSDLAALRAALAAGTPIVDTRPADAYAAGHIPGAISIPLGPAFLTWAGWLLPYDRPIALLGDAGQPAAAARRLRLIGLDRVAGAWTAAVLDAWMASGRALATIRRTDVARLQARLARGDVQVLDVRTAAEYAAGHIAGSLNIPLGHLPDRMDDIPAGRTVAVQCQGGTRSAIGAGLLDARGRADVLDVPGGFGAWQHAGLPVEREAHAPAPDAVPVRALAAPDEKQPQAVGRREASVRREVR